MVVVFIKETLNFTSIDDVDDDDDCINLIDIIIKSYDSY